MHLRGLSKVFFSVSNEKVDGGEAVQKKWKEEDLDGEVENGGWCSGAEETNWIKNKLIWK